MTTAAGFSATSTVLPDGEVLVMTGGGDQLYNPATGTWTKIGSISYARNGQVATLLPDGDVHNVGVSGYLRHGKSSPARWGGGLVAA
jgi:hypothetical protein